MFVADEAGNTKWYGTDELNQLGVQTTFEVLDGVSDSTAPTVKSYTLDSYTFDVSQSDITIRETARLSDDISGVTDGNDGDFVASAQWKSPSGNSTLFGGSLFNLESGDYLDGTFKAETVLNQYSETGIWTLDNLFVADEAGNTKWYDTDELNQLGVQTTFEVMSEVNSQSQTVTTSSDEVTYKPGGLIHLPLIYDVSTGDANLSGLTLNVHYDSTRLAPEGADHGVTDMIDAAVNATADLPDVDDLDNDPMTNKMVQLVWASFDNSFPDQDLPFQLATVSFESLDDPSAPIDPLTGSRIHFTASGTASGYDFVPTTTTLTPRGFDLDVDGDGEVTALGDGLMIIRKLFGPAFADDKLTDKAISPNATRTTQEIHDFIQDGINSGDLDVDLDGDTTALGDGLMVIRHLFGPAFAGNKLTDKAISPDSPYEGQDNAWELVAATIDALSI